MERWLEEEHIHKFYPHWDLSTKSDAQVYAICLRLLSNPPPVARPSKDEGSMYHQMTLFEFGLK